MSTRIQTEKTWLVVKCDSCEKEERFEIDYRRGVDMMPRRPPSSDWWMLTRCSEEQHIELFSIDLCADCISDRMPMAMQQAAEIDKDI